MKKRKEDWDAEFIDGTEPNMKLQGSTVHSVQERDKKHVSGTSMMNRIKFWETLEQGENAKLARNSGPVPKIQQTDRK